MNPYEDNAKDEQTYEPNPRDTQPSYPQAPAQQQTPYQNPSMPSQPQENAPTPTSPTQNYQQPQTMYAPSYPPAGRSNKKKIAIIIALVLTLLGACTVAAYFMYFTPKSPDDVFKASLNQALSTSNVTQLTKTDGTDMSFTITYDLKDIKKPRVNTAVSISEGSMDVSIQGYGTMENSYMRIQKFDGGLIDLPAKLKNTWVQVINNGVVAEGATELDTFYPLYDPSRATLGQYIFGNFSENDRKALVDYAINRKIYDYDPSTVTKETLDGREVYVYSVKIDDNRLKEYNKEVGKLMAIEDSRLDTVLATIEGTDAKLYVDIKDSRLVKVHATSAMTTTTTYSQWNQTTLPNEPSATYQYEEFIRLASEEPAPTQSEMTEIQARARDTERQTDVQAIHAHLEAYYAENGQYPLLSELNDPAWRTENLSGLDAKAFQDPKATDGQIVAKPTVDKYSYEVGNTTSLGGCDNIGQLCEHYRLTAVLENGTRIIKDSLN